MYGAYDEGSDPLVNQRSSHDVSCIVASQVFQHKHLEQLHRQGFVVIDDVISPAQITEARTGTQLLLKEDIDRFHAPNGVRILSFD